MYSRTVQYNYTIIDLYDRSVVASKNVKKIMADLAISPLAKHPCDQSKFR